MNWGVLTPILLFIAVLACSEIGYRGGKLYGPKDEAFSKHLGLISGAMFALVAFLIGFGFSGAASRYIDHLDLVVKEANALGTAYLRADVLPEPMRDEMKTALRQYTAGRLDLLRSPDPATTARLLADVSPQQTHLWDIALSGTADNPQRMLLVLPPLNDVIDLHTTHLAVARRHIPTEIMAGLLLSAGLALALASFGNGQIGRRFLVLNFVYGFVLAAALWMMFDLDHPLQGIIKVSDQPLVDTLASFKP
jgi:hypothetical protein